MLNNTRLLIKSMTSSASSGFNLNNEQTLYLIDFGISTPYIDFADNKLLP